MHGVRNGPAVVLSAAIFWTLMGCVTETAWVPISYVLKPERGMPPGMTSVAVMDSKVNEMTDRKWSELAANMIQDLIQEANHRFSAGVKVADRKHLKDVMDEQDLAASGITVSSDAAQGGRVMRVQGVIQSEINVKVETHQGRATTISDLFGFGGGGDGYGEGGGEIRTREVETVSRNITVQTVFKLVDMVNNQNWITYAPRPYSRWDRTSTSPLFGSAQTEADLTPRDQIIGEAVAEGAREFVSRILPCEMKYEIAVRASRNKNCTYAVKLLRADEFGEALSYFKRAIAEDPEDDRALFGAGVACEAAGDHEHALRFYKRAYGMSPHGRYRAAKKRLAKHVGRIRELGRRRDPT